LTRKHSNEPLNDSRSPRRVSDTVLLNDGWTGFEGRLESAST